MDTDSDLERDSLKEGMRELRGALEHAHGEVAAAEQRVRAEYNDQISQLQETVVALRDQLRSNESSRRPRPRLPSATRQPRQNNCEPP